MTVKYTAVARGKPGDPDAPKKYYALVKSKGKVTVRNIAQDIASMSTVSPVDLAAMIEAFLTVIPKELAKGNIVHLGDFGSFSLRVQGQGAETAQELGARHIAKTLVTFRPGKRFKEILNNVSFEKE